jgi:hypothetical protein
MKMTICYLSPLPRTWTRENFPKARPCPSQISIVESIRPTVSPLPTYALLPVLMFIRASSQNSSCNECFPTRLLLHSTRLYSLRLLVVVTQKHFPDLPSPFDSMLLNPQTRTIFPLKPSREWPTPKVPDLDQRFKCLDPCAHEHKTKFICRANTRNDDCMKPDMKFPAVSPPSLVLDFWWIFIIFHFAVALLRPVACRFDLTSFLFGEPKHSKNQTEKPKFVPQKLP